MHTMEYPKKVEILKSHTQQGGWNRFLVGDGDVLVDLFEKKDGAAQEIARRWNAHERLVEALADLMNELKCRDEDYDMRVSYGEAHRLLEAVAPQVCPDPTHPDAPLNELNP